jgi:SAM-dependent methyltransferase
LTLALFAAAQVLSATLLFLLEPLFAKLVLPRLGGSPSVWTVCVIFFQLAVLAGAFYAHALSRLPSVRRQALVHGGLLAVACLWLPPALREGAPPSAAPVGWLLGRLLMGAGPLVVLLAATTALFAGWFVRTGHRLGRDPYFLYASSNTGSLAGLLAYPLIAERWLSVRAQGLFWSAGFAFFGVLALTCAVLSLRASAGVTLDLSTAPPAARQAAFRSSAPTRWRWFFVAFVPSSLYLGFTTWVTTDLAAVPLLWVIPLAVYLATYVAGFARRPFPRRPDPALIVQPFVVYAVAIQAFASRGALGWGTFAAHLAVVALCCLVCHRALAEERPDPQEATVYYVCLALGGVAGGLWNTFVAPRLFDASVGEYPFALALTLLCRPARARGKTTRAWVDLVLPLGALLVLLEAARQAAVRSSPLAAPRPSAALAAVAVAVSLPFLFWPGRRRRLAAGLAALLIVATLQSRGYRHSLFVERTFFGIHRVRSEGTFHVLVHGDTRHGVQCWADPCRREPLGYHTRSSPVGRVLATRKWGDVGVVGLGAGVLAAYGHAGQRWTFYELDPVVEAIARDPTLFTYLRDTSAELHVVLGDARLALAAGSARHDLIVLDAFSSDAVPVHLLTREAVALYVSRLAPGGLLVFNVSNRYVRLGPVLAGVAAALGLQAWMASDLEVTAAEARSGKFPSQWVLMAPAGTDTRWLAGAGAWRALAPSPGARLWTDQCASIVDAVSLTRQR